MIVDLNLRGRRVLVAGGGGEAEKRVNSLLDQGCEIILVAGGSPGHSMRPSLARLAETGAIRLVRQTIRDAGFVADLAPDVVITTTDDRRINEMIMGAAKEAGVIAYSSDDPEGSDFANLAVTAIAGGLVRVAVSTGGRSPAMSKEIKARIKDMLDDVVTKEDIDRITTHDTIRRIVRESGGGRGDDDDGSSNTRNNNKNVPPPENRHPRARLYTILDDAQVAGLIREDRLDEARERIIAMLESPGR